MESCNNSDTSTTDNTSDISNDTVICHDDDVFNRVVFQVPTIIYISVIIQIILIIAIFFGNSLVIFLIARFRHLHSISNFFMACLSGADIGLSLAMIPGVVITLNPLFGASKFKCLLLWCSIIFTSSTSCLTLLVVTFDRFLHIMRPVLYPILMNRKRAVRIISIVWAYAFFYAVVLPFAGINQIYRKNFFICFEFSKVFSSTYLHFYFYVNGVLPFLAMCLMYGFILKIVLHRLWSTTEPTSAGRVNNQATMSKRWFRRELKTIKTLMIILGFTGAAWVPSTIIFLKQIYNPSYVPNLELRAYVSWFSYLNSAVNPIVYALRSDRFRSTAYNLLCKNSFVADTKVFGRRHQNVLNTVSTEITNEPRSVETIV